MPEPVFRNIKAVFFDLDGTLVDTAPDLIDVLNQLLTKHNRPVLAYEAVRPWVSNGANALLKLGFSIDTDDPDHTALRDEYLDMYLNQISKHSRLFSGMDKVLKKLESSGIHWGVVTNKPAFLTDVLLKNLHLDKRSICAVSGDTLTNRKPHPEPLLYAAKQADTPPETCVYVGDAARDIIAAKAANMPSIAALFGYIPPEEQPEQWHADAMINHPEELLSLLDEHAH